MSFEDTGEEKKDILDSFRNGLTEKVKKTKNGQLKK